MIQIQLEGKEYKMPSCWEEVNLEMFEGIMKHSSLLSEYKSQTQYALDMFVILTGAPLSELEQMTRKSFEELSKHIEWVNDEVKPTKKKSWVFDGVEYMAVENLDSLTMGDSISLEMMINDSNENNLLTNIMPILIRKVKKISKTNGKIKKVPDSFDADAYAETRELFRKRLMVADIFELKSFF